MQKQTAVQLLRDIKLTTRDIDFYNAEGYLLLPKLVSADKIARIRAEIMAIMRAMGLEKSKLRQTTQYLADSLLDKLVNSPILNGLAEQLMAGPSSIYMPFTAVKSRGGGGEFHIHQDNQYTTFDGPGINFWFACDEMTPENGCLQIVPRSHLQGTLKASQSPDGDQHKTIDFEPDNLMPVLMQAGDCVAFSRLTLHGSGKNHTKKDRVAYSVQFHRNDVSYVDDKGEKKRLLEHPKWQVQPVTELGV